MLTEVRAINQYLVRFGELRFGELVLEALATIGFDTFDIAPLCVPLAPTLTAVVEIVDRADNRVVRRFRDDADEIKELYSCIERDALRLDAATFETVWALRGSSS